MSVATLLDLPPVRQTDVLVALAAVETADTPVRPANFRALLDPALRATLSRCLHEQGRILLKVGDGYLSGYDNNIAEKLAAEGLGVLRPDDRAVLALVLLHCIAIPRAAGRIKSNSWLDAEPTTRQQLAKSQVPDTKIRMSLQRLRDGNVVAWGPKRSIVPGPQFARLTPEVSAALWEELVLLAQPHGVMADVIRRRRAHSPAPAVPARPATVPTQECS